MFMANTYTGLEVAIIGMSGRFPGARSIDEFWENIKNGKESISFFSDQELEEEGIESALLKNPAYIKAKGYMHNVEFFDAGFFSYSPKEAQLMDPQMRILHECVWEGLEDSGYNPEEYKGAIGLFLGASVGHEWLAKISMHGVESPLDVFSTPQLSDKDFISSRISYKLDLKGPSSTIFTACSTSLVCVHQAVQSLLSGECSMAIAGAISSSLPNKSGYFYQDGMLNSRDGHCRPFDAGATGTVFSNGVGIVVLKSLEDAISDNDNIYAIIKGSAINNDGSRKVGFTAPSVTGQAEVLRAAFKAADVSPESIGYIEAHGTGTAMGDPVEFEGLKIAFNTSKKQFCRLGSVKANIGHLDTAAGIAGLIKTVYALKNKVIPPTIHFEKPNPQIDLENSPFKINNALEVWDEKQFPRRAGVSSFGVGGTNAHIVLEEFPHHNKVAANSRYQLVLFSGRTEGALKEASRSLTRHIKKNKNTDLESLSYTLQVGRKHFNCRNFILAKDLNEIVEQTGKMPAGKTIKSFNPPYIVFMFPGQGSQYMNMAKGLYDSIPFFKKELDQCFKITKENAGIDLRGIIFSSNERENEALIDRTDISQLLIFSFEYALSNLLIHYGIKPDAMIGHSIGEYTAACVSGVYSFTDTIRLITSRGELMKRADEGSMLSIPLPSVEVIKFLNASIEIAAVNSPNNTVVAGKPEDIKKLQHVLAEKGIASILLNTSIAFHTRSMKSLASEFAIGIAHIKSQKPNIPYISNVTGRWMDQEEPGAQYWAEHLVKPVKFSDGIGQLLNRENAVFVEVGPGNVLTTFVRHHKTKNQDLAVLNFVRHQHEQQSDEYYFLNRLGQAWLSGVKINWGKLYESKSVNRISCSNYSFEI
jgi:acyl transferase domain-containing protein